MVNEIIDEFKHIRNHLDNVVSLSDMNSMGIKRYEFNGLILYDERFRVVCEYNTTRLYVISKNYHHLFWWHNISGEEKKVDINSYLTDDDYRFQIDTSYTEEELKNIVISILLEDVGDSFKSIMFSSDYSINQRLELYERVRSYF